MTGLPAVFSALALALLLDRFIGEPDWLWKRVRHPVAVIGAAIDGLDTALNDLALPFEARRRRGAAALAILVAAAGLAGLAVHLLVALMPFGWAFEAVVVAVFLAQKSLVDHVAAVGRALGKSLDHGRTAVAQIVGRDVTALDEPGVARAAIESLAENFSDGVVAPAFWYLLLGLPGLFVAKLVNTADSMIGNRSPRHEAFGWASARLDDFMNFAPARLSALIIAIAARLVGFDAGAALRAARSDAAKHKSLNAGWPEAAAAGALGLAFGGPRRYGAIEVDGAWLNPGGRRDGTVRDMAAAVRLIDAAWAVLLVLVAFGGVTALAIGR